MPRSPDQIPESTLRLLLTPGLGPARLRRLREQLGGDDRIAAATADELVRHGDLAPAAALTLAAARDAVDPAPEREAMAAKAARMILVGDADYPTLLAAIPDPPPALWIRGALEPQDGLAVAVVGARRCTAYGQEQASRFAALLAQCSLTIVSGAALGIDAEAHRAALRVRGRTLAVLGCGLGRAYPPQNAGLIEAIAGAGCAVLSEHPMGAPPLAVHFPRRNRIISGLCVGVLVIEAAAGSGALITARLAAEDHGREVMVVPGRADCPASRGCLAAVRDGWAGLVLDHVDVLRQLQAASHLIRGAADAAAAAPGTAPGTAPTAAMRGRAGLSPSQQTLLDAVGRAAGGATPDELARATGESPARILADVTLLEVRGLIRRCRRGLRLAQ
jgi:DNA processing protein